MQQRTPIEGITDYNKYVRKKWMTLAGLLILLIASCLLSLSVGSSGLGLREIISALFTDEKSPARTIIRNVRLPRIGAGVAVGIALSMAGCIMQNVLRNPLASASTLGVAQGASFGAAVAIICLGAGIQTNAGGSTSALTVTDPYLVTVCAFAGGMATTVLILFMSRLTGMSPGTMVLAGVAISSLFTGATTLIQYFADDVMLATIVYWTFGSLGRAGTREITLIFALNGLAFLYFFWNRWNYNAMEGGTHTAKSLGVPVDTLVVVSMTVCSLIAAVSVAFVGCISFVGLIAPHMVRRLVGNDHRFLIPASALFGATLMILAEIMSRTLVSPSVLPIGALTSFLGATLFLGMVIKKGRVQ